MHGWAGIIGGIVSTICCAFAEENFGSRYSDYFYSPHDQEVRSGRMQAGYQLATLGLSLGLAIFGGLLAGFIATRPIFGTVDTLFSDLDHWHEVEPPTDDDLHFGQEDNYNLKERKEGGERGDGARLNQRDNDFETHNERFQGGPDE